jgi:tRNA G10  N-methylase Trm11
MLSRAIPDGGWFRWIEKSDASDQIISLYHQQVLSMLGSLEQVPHKVERNNVWRAIEKDARQLDILKGKFDALITSPPYPNRHDYSRIFHIELLSIGLSERKITRLRHNSIRSHVEARAYYSSVFDYQKPAILDTCLQSLPEDADTRIAPMLAGYFEDMYICLKAAHRILKPGAPCALVVGNVRHAGIMIPVDEIMIEIGEQVGFTLSKAHVARMRGNSAQQMAKFGRQPARETIVILLS